MAEADKFLTTLQRPSFMLLKKKGNRMNSRQKFRRPKTFWQGKFYLRHWPAEDEGHGDFSIVSFSSYTASPAYLIILDTNGKRIRCPRDDLFELPGENIRLSESRINFIRERFKSLAGILQLIHMFCELVKIETVHTFLLDQIH